RSATAKPAICASVASPARIADIACSTISAGRSSRRSRRPIASGHSAVFILTRTLPARVCAEPAEIASRVRCERAAGGLAALTDQAASFLLGKAAPHALLLAGGDRVLEARLAHRAHEADLLRSLGGVFRRRVEELGVGPEAAGVLPPTVNRLLDCHAVCLY